MVWLTDADDAKILLDIPFLMNYVIINQLALNLIDTCLDNMLLLLSKLLQCFSKIGKIDYSRIVKIWFVKFCMLKFKQYVSLSFQWISTILTSKRKLRYA